MKEFKGYGIRIPNYILLDDELVKNILEYFYLVRSIPNVYAIDKMSCSCDLLDSLNGNWLIEVVHPSCSSYLIDEKTEKYIDALLDYLKDYNPSTNLIIHGYLLGD